MEKCFKSKCCWAHIGACFFGSGVSSVSDRNRPGSRLAGVYLCCVDGLRLIKLLQPATAAPTTQPKRKGHFSRCPKQYKHYCIKGRCRLVVAEQTPSCVCDEGYTGARCERVDLFYLRGDRGQILVICLIAVMVIFIILVIGVCTCCHPLRKHHKKRKKEEEREALGKDMTPVNEDIEETNIA